MKTYEQSLKQEKIDPGSNVQEARGKVAKVEYDAAAAEEAKRSLEIELLKAEAAAHRKEESERQGKETKEKINSVA